MEQLLELPSVRRHVMMAAASQDLFSTRNRKELDELDAVSIDLDACLESGSADTAVEWIEKSNSMGKQVFVVGSRESLLKADEITQNDVTLIERTGPLEFVSGRPLAEAVSEMLEQIYAPFHLVTGGYVFSPEESTLDTRVGQIPTSLPRRESHPIEPTYFQPVLTKEQDRQLLAFLRRPEQESEATDTDNFGRAESLAD
jgi:hypothetical protein